MPKSAESPRAPRVYLLFFYFPPTCLECTCLHCRAAGIVRMLTCTPARPHARTHAHTHTCTHAGPEDTPQEHAESSAHFTEDFIRASTANLTIKCAWTRSTPSKLRYQGVPGQKISDLPLSCTPSYQPTRLIRSKPHRKVGVHVQHVHMQGPAARAHTQQPRVARVRRHRKCRAP